MGDQPLRQEGLRACHAGSAGDRFHAEAHPLLVAVIRGSNQTGEDNDFHGKTF
jgi:hypothetical protein